MKEMEEFFFKKKTLTTAGCVHQNLERLTKTFSEKILGRLLHVGKARV
jgi:hypothetical protein